MKILIVIVITISIYNLNIKAFGDINEVFHKIAIKDTIIYNQLTAEKNDSNKFIMIRMQPYYKDKKGKQYTEKYSDSSHLNYDYVIHETMLENIIISLKECINLVNKQINKKKEIFYKDTENRFTFYYSPKDITGKYEKQEINIHLYKIKNICILNKELLEKVKSDKETLAMLMRDYSIVLTYKEAKELLSLLENIN